MGSPKKSKVPDYRPSVEELEMELATHSYHRNFGRVLRTTFVTIIVVIAAAVVIAMLLLPVLQVDGRSMANTLESNDIVVAFSRGDIKRNDVVAFYYQNNILIKRVIATSGQWVDIDADGNIYVDGRKLDEPYVAELAFGDCNIELPYQVPEGRYFMVGDHRATSIDSRNTAVGCIPTEMLIGKVIFRIYPFSTIGKIQ